MKAEIWGAEVALAAYFTIIILLAVGAGLAGCTQQQRAKKFGGNATIDLSKGKKLINVTWKDDNIWYLTRPMNESDKEETYEFTESSNYGIAEGKVTIREHKQ